MSQNAMSLKAKINNYAKKNNIAAQVVMQNYMFEKFLSRLSASKYKNNFIIKGGVLISSIVGLNVRTTMDLDTTIQNISLSEKDLNKIIAKICETDIDDNIEFKIISINPIRGDDLYGGFTVRIDALYDSITTPLSVDITTGDVITPNPIIHEFSGLLDDNLKIELLAYNLETILSEKIESILTRGVFNTRPRDFYDVYVLTTTKEYNNKYLKDALYATAVHRGTLDNLHNAHNTVEKLYKSKSMKDQWEKYRKTFPYAFLIEFEDTLKQLETIVSSNIK